MMDAMARLSALITVIAADIYAVPQSGRDAPEVRMTFGEPEPLNEQVKQPRIYLATDAMDFSWRDSRHEQLNVAYPVYALVYYPREAEDSVLAAGDFVERLAAELTAEDRWFGNIPGFIEAPSGDYLGFDQSANCHRWVLYFEYRRVPVPPHVPFPGDVPLRTVTVKWLRDIQDTWVFQVTQFEMEPADIDWSLGDGAIDVTLPALDGNPAGVEYAASPLPAGLAFDSATRKLTGTPTENGVTTVAYRASQDGLGTVTADFTITVTGLWTVRIEGVD